MILDFYFLYLALQNPGRTQINEKRHHSVWTGHGTHQSAKWSTYVATIKPAQLHDHHDFAKTGDNLLHFNVRPIK